MEDPSPASRRWSRRRLLRALGLGGIAAGIGPSLPLRASAAAIPAGLPHARGGARNQEMRTRAIPSSGEPIPVVGMGTWQTFDVDPDSPEGRSIREVLRLFVEHGGRVVDSSPMYGRSEAVVGELARELGVADELWYATKVWTRGRSEGIEQMERSFELLGTATVDLMQVHNLVDWRTHLGTLREWKQEGRIRYVGITHYRTEAFDDVARILEEEDLDFVQINYNMAVRRAEERLLPLAADRGTAVMVNRPYEGGSLFRRVRGRELPEWASEWDIASWGQFFLKYLLGHPAITCVIPATSDPEHVVDNVGAGYGALPDEATRRRMVRHLEAG